MTSHVRLYLFAEVSSRFTFAFVVAAIRFELLVVTTVSTLSFSLIVKEASSVLAGQVAGALMDAWDRKWLYVCNEICTLLCLVALCILPSTGPLLVWSHVAFGVLRAFARPISAALPPLLTTEVNIWNSWKLTLGKVVHSVAPLVCSMLISTSLGGFRSAMRLMFILQLAIIYSKARTPFPHRASDSGRAGTCSRLTSVHHTVRHFVEGFSLLLSQRTICVLTVNTVVTNMFVYPMQIIIFPLVFKQMPRSESMDALATALGIHKEKAWMNFSALVSLGGVVGPVISTVVVHRWKYDAAFGCAKRAMIMQIAVSVCMAFALMAVRGSAFAVGALFVLWTATVCSNNLFTIYLSSLAQIRCEPSKLGRVMANMFTLFSLSSMAGSALFGHAAEEGLNVVLAFFVVGIVARGGVLLAINFAPLAVDAPDMIKTS